jgi:hypothetical protein
MRLVLSARWARSLLCSCSFGAVLCFQAHSCATRVDVPAVAPLETDLAFVPCRVLVRDESNGKPLAGSLFMVLRWRDSDLARAIYQKNGWPQDNALGMGAEEFDAIAVPSSGELAAMLPVGRTLRFSFLEHQSTAGQGTAPARTGYGELCPAGEAREDMLVIAVH